MFNKETLDIYELNSELANLLFSYFAETISPADKSILEEFLKENAINLDSIESPNDLQFSLNTPIVHINEQCNSKCIMCDCWKKDINNRTFKELDVLFKKFSVMGAESVMISGGEPLLHPELLDIIDSVTENGMKVQLNTNGVLLHKNIELANKNIDMLVVSVDGFNSKDYENVRGLNGLNLVLNNIKEFKRLSPNSIVGIRVTLTKYTLTKLPELIELCKSWEIDHVGFSPLDIDSDSFSREMSGEREKKLKELLIPNEEELYEITQQLKQGQIKEMVDKAFDEGLFSWNSEKFMENIVFYQGLYGEVSDKFYTERPCSFPYFSLIVDYDKTIKPCFYSNYKVDIEQFDENSWELDKILGQLRNSKRCIGCRGKVFCG